MSPPVLAFINDDREFLEMLNKVIETERDYDVVTYLSGEGAISFLEETLPDVLVLDIRMENKHSGAFVMKEMRKHPKLSDTPVIICTADSAFVDEYSEWMKSLRCTWIQKPFDLDELLEHIDNAVDGCRRY